MRRRGNSLSAEISPSNQNNPLSPTIGNSSPGFSGYSLDSPKIGTDFIRKRPVSLSAKTLEDIYPNKPKESIFSLNGFSKSFLTKKTGESSGNTILRNTKPLTDDKIFELLEENKFNKDFIDNTMNSHILVRLLSICPENYISFVLSNVLPNLANAGNFFNKLGVEQVTDIVKTYDKLIKQYNKHYAEFKKYKVIIPLFTFEKKMEEKVREKTNDFSIEQINTLKNLQTFKLNTETMQALNFSLNEKTKRTDSSLEVSVPSAPSSPPIFQPSPSFYNTSSIFAQNSSKNNGNLRLKPEKYESNLELS